MRRQQLLADVSIRVMLLLSGVVSCSVLYDLNKVQCEIQDDCVGFDRDAQCIDGICVQPDLDSTSSNTGDTTSNDTSTTGGGSGGSGGGTTGSGGNSGGSTSTTDTSSTTGEAGAGAGGAPGCLTNQECIDENSGNPALCRDGDCINLDHPECPVVLGVGTNMVDIADDDLKPYLFGAYSTIGSPLADAATPTMNYKLAVNEINAQIHPGLLVNGVRRPFVGVVCNALGDLDASMTHLADTVGVPAIIASLHSPSLLPVFEDYAKEKNIFLMSPLDADSTLTDSELDPDGLMWHMLPEAADLAPAYKPLMARTEALIRENRNLPDPETDPLKVVMVVAEWPFMQDIANYISSNLVFNGKSAAANGAEGNFKIFSIPSYLSGSTPDQSTIASQIRGEFPDVVLAIATKEFMYSDMISVIENGWEFLAPDDQPPPFYLLSPYMYTYGETLTRATEYDNLSYTEFVPMRQRLLGVNFAAAADPTLYQNYYLRLTNGESELSYLQGTENWYDAAYYLMYAMVGAGAVPVLRGTDVAQGMTRLLGGGSASFDVDPTEVVDALSFLRSTTSSMRLTGTLGPPDFNTGTGARRGSASIFCIDGEPGALEFTPDVLTYDPGTEALSGPQPCSVEGFTVE